MASPTRIPLTVALDLSADHCPSDAGEVADLYVLNRLTPGQAQIFEEHLIQCPECAGKTQLAQDFITALRDVKPSQL